MNRKIIIPSIVMIISLAAAFYSMRENLSPYVSFDEAISSGKRVQVMGYPYREGGTDNIQYTFFLVDDKNPMKKLKVITDVPPSGLLKSEKIVVYGIYDQKLKAFMAEKIMLKCPSKYTQQKE